MKRNKKGKISFFVFLALFFATFFALYSISNAMVVEIAEKSYGAVLSTASYYAIEKTLDNKIDYNSLVSVHKNSQGDITMITTDAYKFNVITTQLANYVTEYMQSFTKNGIEVPLGVFSGIRLLQGFGEKINMQVISVNSVKCDVVSSFESAGINQTRHTLYLTVTPNASVITRVTTKKLIENTTVMLFDNVIIGKVPEIYLQGSVFSAYKST